MNEAANEPQGPTQLIEREPSRDPLAMIALAVSRGVDADQLGKLLDLQERVERNKAQTAFADAITSFQREMPPVHKGKSVDGKYKYATYEGLMAVAGPLLRKYGIVATFDSAPDGEMLRVTCRVRVGIHVEPTNVTLPMPGGNKLINATQVFGQAVSYGKRYALCAALNIITTDEDTDANYADGLAAEAEKELQDLWDEYAKLVGNEAQNDWQPFLDWAVDKPGAKSLADIPSKRFKLAKDHLAGWWRDAKAKADAAAVKVKAGAR